MTYQHQQFKCKTTTDHSEVVKLWEPLTWYLEMSWRKTLVFFLNNFEWVTVTIGDPKRLLISAKFVEAKNSDLRVLKWFGKACSNFKFLLRFNFFAYFVIIPRSMYYWYLFHETSMFQIHIVFIPPKSDWLFLNKSPWMFLQCFNHQFFSNVYKK